jgi:hypothetical protein
VCGAKGAGHPGKLIATFGVIAEPSRMLGQSIPTEAAAAAVPMF